MSAIVTNLAGKHAKRVVTAHAKQYEPEDPFYLHYVDDSGKEKRVKVSSFEEGLRCGSQKLSPSETNI